MSKPLISVVVPVYNEAAALRHFHEALAKAIQATTKDSYEIIYVDDGSRDDSEKIIRGWTSGDTKIKFLKLSRNFGKEIATTAGLHAAAGEAILTIDGDGQHPPDLIPEFIKKWRAGNKVVIGIRTANQKEGFIKRWGSKLFYNVTNKFLHLGLDPGATDFRLIDRSVQQEFARMTERNRITRGLIDWLGYKREYIEYKANPRLAGDASYSFKKLFKLAIDSIVSLSISPLYISAYIGAVVLPASVLIGFVMIVDALMGDPLSLHATGSAYLVVLLLFLVGVLLVSQGIIGLYLSHIHTETQNRPLYIVDEENSVNIDA